MLFGILFEYILATFFIQHVLILPMRKDIEDLPKEKLLDYIEMLSKNWLAHDGCWFQAIELELGMEEAIKYDVAGWKRFTVIEAKKIKKFLGLDENPGIAGLIEALKYRLYANINVQEIIDITEKSCVFHMNKCRVQTARNRNNLPDFPCKPVGIEEYGLFAKAIDPRIKTECVCCPPDDHPKEYYCGWKFTLE